MGYMCLSQFWFTQGICLGVGLFGHMVVLFLVFKGISLPSSIVTVSIYILINSARVFPLSTSSSAFIVCRLFDDVDSQQEFPVRLRKLKQGLCINLEGWDGREIQKGGDICILMADSC